MVISTYTVETVLQTNEADEMSGREQFLQSIIKRYEKDAKSLIDELRRAKMLLKQKRAQRNKFRNLISEKKQKGVQTRRITVIHLQDKTDQY